MESAWSKKDADETGSRALKAYATGFTYLLYADIRFNIRATILNDKIKNVNSGALSIREAMLEILDSHIGEADKNSFKYIFLNRLTGLTAGDDHEAKLLINESINYLKVVEIYKFDEIRSLKRS